MSVDHLLSNYSRQVRLPWSTNMSGKQRVWFAVYPPAEERRVRARLPVFETRTLEANHGWATVDLTRIVPDFLSTHPYREKIFEQPQHLRAGNALEKRAAASVKEAFLSEGASSTVVAIIGLASLFDLMRVSSLIEAIEDSIAGRLLVLFPGEYAGNIYRFMDSRDGFNYMAVPITAMESFINS